MQTRFKSFITALSIMPHLVHTFRNTVYPAGIIIAEIKMLTDRSCGRDIYHSPNTEIRKRKERKHNRELRQSSL